MGIPKTLGSKADFCRRYEYGVGASGAQTIALSPLGQLGNF
jgi:hypothetical protein